MLDSLQQSAREQFEKQSARYGKSHILADTSDLEELFAQSPVQGGFALDIATGGGHTALFLARNGFQVVASDLSPAMLENTRKLAEEAGFRVETNEHSAEKLPYAQDTFDFVACRVAAHHFSAPEVFVSEVARVLRPGGCFLLIDGSVPDGVPEAEDWIHSVEKLRDPSHGRFLTPGQWGALCEASGMKVLVSRCTPFKQPDLEWYFETAATAPENRGKVRSLIQSAPEEARRVFALAEEEGKIVWWWPRLGLLARNPLR